MLGFNPRLALGHFTSGGTVANIEALWRARYRADLWMSLALKLNLDHHYEMDILDACHMGWLKYEDLRARHEITETELREMSSLVKNPWQMASLLRRAFGHDYAGPVVFVPNSKHYSWPKAVSLLGIGEEALWPLQLDSLGVVDTSDLEEKIDKAWKQKRPILTVVSILGTTELGEIDPLDRIQKILDQQKHGANRHIWHHVDAAYGGFFRTLLAETESLGADSVLSDEARLSLEQLPLVDSVTLDPHKLGYVPYACGALVVRDAATYRVSSFDAKYLESTTPAERWSRTLEGSRSALGAAATWMTSKTIGFTPDGYGRILKRTMNARNELYLALQEITEIKLVEAGHTNLLCFHVNFNSDLRSDNVLTEELTEALNRTGEFFVSKTTLLCPQYQKLVESHCAKNQIKMNDSQLTLVRIVIMNPFTKNRETSFHYIQGFVETVKEQIKNLKTGAPC